MNAAPWAAMRCQWVVRVIDKCYGQKNLEQVPRCLREYRFTRGSPDQSIIGLFLFVL
jgi:hypothetical protein